MRRSLISIGIGIIFGLVACLALVVMVAMIQPGWLSQAMAEATPTEPSPLSPTPVVNPTRPSVLPPAATIRPPAAPVGASKCGGPARMTIALLGVDDRSQNYAMASRTDAISLVSINFVTPTASLLSFPRDLYVPLPNLDNVGISQDRLNTAYEFGEAYKVPGGGPAEFKDTMEWNFGIRVDRYVLANFGAFVSLVDALGGVDVDVPEAIYDPAYPNNSDTGTFIFSLPAGRQHMDGETALRYARTRHQDDDYHRLQRQQLVLLAIRDKLVSPQVVTRIPALVATLGHMARTDLTPSEITALACMGTQINRSAITSRTIDGSMVIPWVTPGGADVSIPNRDMIAPLVAKFLGQ